jgi:hypothetical protein
MKSVHGGAPVVVRKPCNRIRTRSSFRPRLTVRSHERESPSIRSPEKAQGPNDAAPEGRTTGRQPNGARPELRTAKRTATARDRTAQDRAAHGPNGAGRRPAKGGTERAGRTARAPIAKPAERRGQIARKDVGDVKTMGAGHVAVRLRRRVSSLIAASSVENPRRDVPKLHAGLGRALVVQQHPGRRGRPDTPGARWERRSQGTPNAPDSNARSARLRRPPPRSARGRRQLKPAYCLPARGRAEAERATFVGRLCPRRLCRAVLSCVVLSCALWAVRRSSCAVLSCAVAVQAVRERDVHAVRPCAIRASRPLQFALPELDACCAQGGSDCMELQTDVTTAAPRRRQPHPFRRRPVGLVAGCHRLLAARTRTASLGWALDAFDVMRSPSSSRPSSPTSDWQRKRRPARSIRSPSWGAAGGLIFGHIAIDSVARAP